MSSLQNKMNNYEVVPPASVWGKVAAALDESALGNEFPQKLYNAEVAPPATAWDNIENVLHPADTKVIPLKRKTPAFIRYAAAAALIGAVAFGIIQFTGGSSKGSLAGANKPDTTKKTTILTDQPGDQVTASVPKEDMILAEAQPAAKTETHKSTTSAASTALYADNDQYTNPIYDYAPVQSLVDRYIMLMTPEGNIIRVSKKLGNMVCCVSGEEQDEDCKSQIKKWQEKLAASPAATSPGNFLDILTLVNSLDENSGVEL